MCEPLETLLITHCAATLAGHKCASLFTWRNSARVCADRVRKADQLLRGKGVRLRLLPECPEGCRVLVYRPKLLQKQLDDPEIQAFLAGRGYAAGDVEGYLDQLARRMGGCGEFPHEVGVFLGYPLADVIGFIENRGQNHCCLGCWKAYSNEQEARRRFALYKKCREVYLSCYQQGFDVLRLTVAA